MTFSIEREITIISLLLASILDDAVHTIRDEHPLLSRIAFPTSAARHLELGADVREKLLRQAKYDVPLFTQGARFAFEDAAEKDLLIRRTADLVRVFVGDLRSSILRSLFSATGVAHGLNTLLPEKVGGNVIAGIDEADVHGWRSKMCGVQPRADGSMIPIVQHLQQLASVCSRDGTFPDLTVLGRNAWLEFWDAMRQQQVFIVTNDDRALPMFNGGVIYCDPSCAPEDGYMLHTSDFELHHSPISVTAGPLFEVPQIGVSINHHRQLVTCRRYRSGRLSRSATVTEARS
ncbi:MAG TPA: hypothetical protein VNT29_10705 [Candidatus Limnocylindrales bacterium]|nr:hypothetical protein [Candidatus Limnocylindrales bacterium]